VAPPLSLLIRHLVSKHGHGDPNVLVERDAEKVRVRVKIIRPITTRTD
jgi:hypothetical protein